MRLQTYSVVTLLSAACLSAQNPPVPSSFQDLYNTLNTQISGFNTAVNAKWNGSSYPYLDCPQLLYASSDLYTQLLNTSYYAGTLEVELNALQALGAKGVTIHADFPILYQPFYVNNPSQYQQFVNFYQQVAQDVHARGMKLVVESAFGQPLAGNQVGVFQTYAKSLTWSQYMAGRAANAVTVAQLIQPDYMTVMYEPDTEASATGQTNLNNVTGVTQLVQGVLTALTQAGVTNVQVGAGVGTWTKNYTQYLTSFAAMPTLNFIDMHIYPINGTDFTAALAAADTIHAAGKQVGMSECWPWKVRDSELGTLSYVTISSRSTFSFWEPIDTSFLQAIVNFAKYKQLAFISPYWTPYMFAYLDYNTYGTLPANTVLLDSDTAAVQANLKGAFTPTGLAWETQNIPPDSTAPAPPAAPTAASVGTVAINLQWSADWDNVGVASYNLYRNGTLLTTSSLITYYDTGLVPGETYTYTLSAIDASGNVSALSAPLVVETIDNTPPSVPTNLAVTGVTSKSVTLSWTLSTGIGGVGGYRILRGTSPSSLTNHGNPTAPPYTDAGVRASTTYYYEVESFNPLGITSGPSNKVSVTTPAH